MSFAFDNHYPHSLPSMTCETTYGSLGERDVQGNAKALALARLVMTSKYPYLIIFSLWWETRSHDSMLISHLGERENLLHTKLILIYIDYELLETIDPCSHTVTTCSNDLFVLVSSRVNRRRQDAGPQQMCISVRWLNSPHLFCQ